jgi:hypothetical protein
VFSDKCSEVFNGLKNFGQTIFRWVWVLAFFFFFFLICGLVILLLILFTISSTVHFASPSIENEKENVKDEREDFLFYFILFQDVICV